jgi:hypothetical protein
MKNIDFLPDVYRQRTALAHARIWWGIVGIIFSVAIGSTAGAQFLLRRSIQRQIDELAPQFEQAQEHVQQLAKLQSQNRSAGELAGLVTYLEQPWPRTQLVAEVVGPLPEEIHLTELIITEEELAKPNAEEGAGPRRRRGQTDDSQQAKLSPAVSDLEALRKTHDHKRAVIEVTGTVADVAVLHKYVSDLGRSPLVSRAQIKSLESAATVVQEKPTQFTLRLQFKPGHGQPSGEDVKPAAIRVAQGGTSP